MMRNLQKDEGLFKLKLMKMKRKKKISQTTLEYLLVLVALLLAFLAAIQPTSGALHQGMTDYMEEVTYGIGNITAPLKSRLDQQRDCRDDFNGALLDVIINTGACVLAPEPGDEADENEDYDYGQDEGAYDPANCLGSAGEALGSALRAYFNCLALVW